MAHSTLPPRAGTTPAGPGVVGAAPRRRARYGSDQASGPRVALRMVVGLVIALIFLAPYVIMAIGSLKSRPEILSVPPKYLPATARFDNYVTMWSTPETPLPQNLISTIIIASCATILVLLVATPGVIRHPSGIPPRSRTGRRAYTPGMEALVERLSQLDAQAEGGAGVLEIFVQPR